MPRATIVKRPRPVAQRAHGRVPVLPANCSRAAFLRAFRPRANAPTRISASVSAALPCAVPRPLAAEPGAAEPAQPTWFFIGANGGHEPLAGRPEHTDALSHDGTWHYQLSGRKAWRLRPTDELLEALVPKRRGAGGAAVPRPPSAHEEIVCHAGDVLLINTRLWWHSTTLPRTVGARARGAPRARSPSPQMPDCELPISTDPNCVVREDAYTGELVLCAVRDIASGEFFTVAADSSDESGESSE
ncbi:hypothetical protein KFE25_002564 [Diacronema lutheri]|uniref:Uncharacterized protein n=1 Tax=Diacronema lutheri TaxID=2081491 RepID=A0A8J6C1U5_DIALT|nr:hypothetical protein KFE25_002564 [Diacronema lutheri]